MGNKPVVGVERIVDYERSPQERTPRTTISVRRNSPKAVLPQLRSVQMKFTAEEVNAAEMVLRARPAPIRIFDQINMRAGDLLRQAKLIAPSFEGKRLGFVGDMDGTIMLLGCLAVEGGPLPSRMLLLDFDERLLDSVSRFASANDFGHIIDVRLYNVFDSVPQDLIGTFDCFYTNPPYGQHNYGESARLFITRGCELCKPIGATGCLILPDDPVRPWTRQAWEATRSFLEQYGWRVQSCNSNAHRYHLDDDGELESCMFTIEHTSGSPQASRMPFEGRFVFPDEIPNFYGRHVAEYPRYIRSNGEWDISWPML